MKATIQPLVDFFSRVAANGGSFRKDHAWLYETSVYALLYGLPLLVLFPYTGLRPDASFEAELQTEAVNFTVGH